MDNGPPRKDICNLTQLLHIEQRATWQYSVGECSVARRWVNSCEITKVEQSLRTTACPAMVQVKLRGNLQSDIFPRRGMFLAGATPLRVELLLILIKLIKGENP